MTPDLDLEALREVVDAATDLPWRVGNRRDLVLSCAGESAESWAIATMVSDKGRRRWVEDAALIVAAVNALPVLLDALEEARGERSTAAMQMAQAFRERDAALSSGDRARRAMNEAKAEVARLTAVVQGVREGIEAWATQLHGIRWEGEPVSDQLRALAGGTDTPQGTEAACVHGIAVKDHCQECGLPNNGDGGALQARLDQRPAGPERERE